MVDADRDDLVLGIVGSGLMGRGIAQIAALAGVRVLLCDARADTAAEARLALGETFAMLVGKGRLAATAAHAEWTARLPGRRV
ncbi:MAG TPA: 3-hydroxyacyl-CoA dehydrogenase NAD-binding domain-containing protein, partial [Rhodocyclaceae bacterium]|nr:3-hydroxyacyl-CoA dehydrogenase NAD-binding domain-containing protein [Rhodocyclaceae bacterium]